MPIALIAEMLIVLLRSNKMMIGIDMVLLVFVI